MHVLYIKGERERRKRQRRVERKWEERQREGKMSGTRGKVEMWDLQRRKITENIWTRGRRKMRPVTCGSHPHPIYLHFIIALISITSHTSLTPFHLLIKVLQLLWAEGKQWKGGKEGGEKWLQRQVNDRENLMDLRQNNVLDAYIFIYPRMNLYTEL